jgi:hypothetical protein
MNTYKICCIEFKNRCEKIVTIDMDNNKYKICHYLNNKLYKIEYEENNKISKIDYFK